MSFASEFKEFLDEYKVIGLAVAIIIGLALTALVQSLVDNIVMPLVAPLIAGGAWKTATVAIGPVTLGVGAFMASVINFVIIALVVFIIVKKVVNEDKKK